jgi:hypothetical protein
VNMVVNLQFHKRQEIFWLAELLLASQEGFCSLNLVIEVVCYVDSVVSPCWGYGFMTQTWLSDNAKEKLCRSNVTFILERSTTAWQVARWHKVETLISGLNPPGRSLSQFWCDSCGDSGTLGCYIAFQVCHVHSLGQVF